MTGPEKATHARELKDNPLWEEMFKELQDELLYLWEVSTWDESKLREFQWQMLKALKLMKGRVDKYINDETLEMKIQEMREGAQGEEGTEERAP